ncbi:MAG TPA: hypothetical protein VE988_09905 [Gemmataceae bacterium]|nr:hypothetical protein [Gemmataceae bacterium]
MSIRFGYKLAGLQHPVLTLGGRFVRPRPVITVTLIGPAATWLFDGLLDTAADDTVFPEWIARRLGIDLSHAPAGMASGVGMVAIPVHFAEVVLRVASNVEQHEWKTWVAFTAAPLRRPLLGFAGFLQFFTATFHGDREEVDLTVNSLYPGT